MKNISTHIVLLFIALFVLNAPGTIKAVEEQLVDCTTQTTDAIQQGNTQYIGSVPMGYSKTGELVVLPNAPVDDEGNTALHIATREGNLSKVKFLLQLGANANARNEYRETPLHKILHCNNRASLGGVVAILFAHGAIVDTIDRNNWTLVYKVIRFGDSGVANMLLAYGADPKVMNNEELLHLASRNCDTTTISLLLEMGADKDVQDKDGKRPLDYAAMFNQLANVELLLEMGADQNLPNQEGYIPLHYAASAGHIAIVERLVKNKDAEIDSERGDNKTPLFLAVKNSHLTGKVSSDDRHNYTAVVTLLLASGANPSVRISTGATLLHCAAARSSLDIVNLLLKYGVDPTLKEKREGGDLLPLDYTRGFFVDDRIPDLQKLLKNAMEGRYAAELVLSLEDNAVYIPREIIAMVAKKFLDESIENDGLRLDQRTTRDV